ncbi:MAG: hypothetical protein HQ492_03785 [Woeseiaceae bacterium]|nr:hypothetical protein [Woeseiaceae bacterium]
MRINILSATPSRHIDVRAVAADLGRLDLSNLYKLRDNGERLREQGAQLGAEKLLSGPELRRARILLALIDAVSCVIQAAA